MQDQTQKRDAGKFDPLMIEEDLARALEVENAVLEFGKEKYGKRGGWMAVHMDRYKSAAERHRRERMKHGIDSVDPETGLLHIAHEIINLQFLLEMHIRANPGYIFTQYNKPAPVAPPMVQTMVQSAPIFSVKRTSLKKYAPTVAEEPQPDFAPLHRPYDPEEPVSNGN